MHREFLMGNEAIALGALAAGVNVVAGYPGTPSTEIIETVRKRRGDDVYVEWSVNEKAALEVCAGAAYAGARTLVTMKCVGLNVAADPLMSLAYIGVKGAMVIVVADDPGPISSQTEQDTRTFAQLAKIPCFDPSGVADAYQMVQDAFALSEELHTPVFLRPTTRVDHGYEAIDVADESAWEKSLPAGFEKDPARWVIFPKLSVRAHAEIEARNASLSGRLSAYPQNRLERESDACAAPRLGVATGGINYAYVRESAGADDCRILRVATPFPFPEELALDFLDGLDEVLCVEELDPVIERALLQVCGRHHLPVRIRGKLSGDVKPSGENSVAYVAELLASFLGRTSAPAPAAPADAPELPVRPPCPRLPRLPTRPSFPCDLPSSAPAARTARASWPSRRPCASRRPSTAATSAATPSATPVRSTCATRACAWAPASRSRRASATSSPTRAASPSSATRPSSPPASPES